MILIILGIVVVGSGAWALRVVPSSIAFENLFADNPLDYAEISTATQERSMAAAVTGTEKLNLPILVYHIVRPSYPNDSRGVLDIAHTPETFDAEMLYLSRTGYHVVNFTDLENYFSAGAPLPSNPIIISFDDGWSNQYRYAFPTLRKYDIPATFFVFTNAIGRPGFLSWDNLREMVVGGMSIAAHSRSHPYLTKITEETKLWNEIQGSKELLEKELGVPVEQFAYPFGQYNASIVAMVKKAGYRSARGDFYRGAQTVDILYELSALNAPTTTALFAKRFPMR